MSRIKILPEILSNKIAAGEVVERPAAVIKELVENAIDAGSSRIQIEVEKGGRSLMRVSDDGMGMGRDDALLAIERYATSKISTDRDLFSIGTLGFRGEALPSIASVSRFSLTTRDEASPSGTEIVVEGGKIIHVRDAGAPRGTLVSVKNLFYNTPARRKFLKTVNTEMGHIADGVARMALGHPGIRFTLMHNGKAVYDWSASPDSRDRIVDILGSSVEKDLRPLSWDRDGLAISGYAASDRHARSTAKGIYLFVNKRFVRDRIVTHALFEGYAGRLMKGRYPLIVLFIELPPDRVDVNVHPTKHEVRFADQKQIHGAVVAAVSEAFREDVQMRNAAQPRPERAEPRFIAPRKSVDAFRPRPNATTPLPVSEKQVSEPMGRYAAETAPPPQPRFISERPPDGQQDLWQTRFFGDLVLIGQLKNTYMVCQGDDGLILIDQHAAHERILYEKIKSRARSNAGHRQQLLMPETIDLGYREAQLLEELMPVLANAGIDIEPFGKNTFAVKAVPGLLADREIKPLILEIIGKTEELGFAPGVSGAMDECYKIMACHGAIRANQSLSEKQMGELLNQMDRCDNPDNCPHGRPTWIRCTDTELEKKFRRIV